MNTHTQRVHEPLSVQIGYDANIMFDGQPGVVCAHFKIPSQVIEKKANVSGVDLEPYQKRLLPEIRNFLEQALQRDIELRTSCQPLTRSKGLDFMFAILPTHGSVAAAQLRTICAPEGTEYNYADVVLPGHHTEIPPLDADNPTKEALNAGLATVISNAILYVGSRGSRLSNHGYDTGHSGRCL